MEIVNKMDQETARYIIGYFPHLLTRREGMAIKHTMSMSKLEHADNNVQLTSMYRKRGWITSDQSVLDLLKDGYDAFELTVATRILSEHGDQVFVNNCPKCDKLARTPYAKQCRHCGYSWRVDLG